MADAWIELALRALAEGGPDAVRIESLARAQGVTKGGFYGYFANRDELLTAALDTWERRSVDEVLARVEAAGGDPRTRGVRAGDETFSAALAPIDLAVRDWARRDVAVAERLRRVDDRRMDFLRELFGPVASDDEDLEARCLVAFSVAIADPLVTAGHRDLDRADVVAAIVRRTFAP